MQELYVPEQDLCIDESMVLWCGRLVFRQYIKNKSRKYGMKLYKLCESDGMILKVQIYSGKHGKSPGNLGHAGEVVLGLMEQYLDKGYNLYTDNFYNSVLLAKRMTERSTHLCGILRFDRKDNPKELVKNKLKKGDMNWMRSDEVVVCKWKDKRDVLMISNMHQPEMVDVANRVGKIVKKPNIVKDYNNGMSGIDRADHMLSYYCSLRKTVCWYKKIGVHLFEIMIHNAHQMY